MPASRPVSSTEPVSSLGAAPPVRRPSSRRLEELSLAQARRVALRAQGLERARSEGGPVTMREFGRLVDRLGLLQIDSVNVLARAHLMPAFSRLGPYDTALLDRAAGRAPRRLVECWAHEASFVPPTTYRLMGYRQRRYERGDWGRVGDVRLQDSPVVAQVLELIAERGPTTAREVHALYESEHPRPGTGWWEWTVAKRVLEYLFFTGRLSSAYRNAAFERCYDLTGRVLPPDVLAAPEPAEADAVRALLEMGARGLGIGTVDCFADYFRIKRARGWQEALRAATAELVEGGVLLPVRVRGWEQRPTYLHRDATLPRSATGRALLSPFDPLVFERRRLEELFGMRYRIEIYVPAPKRVHGYYVLPFLLGETLAARVDLKADRQAGVLLVQAAHREPQAPIGTAEELLAELNLMASWLGLSDVVVPPGAPGDLVRDLRAAVPA